MGNVIVIGVAGGTGSGKTTLVNRLKEEFNNEVVTISHDHYYKSNDHLPLEERKKLNYDHPNAFDTALMVSHIKRLKNGESIDRPSYSFVEHTRTKETVHITPAKVIIVEGILIFENKELLSLMDIKIFVDTDADVRLIRRLLRDVKERGRDLDSVINQYLTTVKPMHEEFVEPSKKNADVIIPEGGFNSVALSMIIDKIKTFLSHE
ncbi:MAG: uridine kinase [Epulopiscium sp.]|jgi:uridine kinase|uniref:Uridine kinase n=2 Tax=Defluviitalea raffinosedens TaxID=1450156 RepID=A0A7C8HJ99_9FIRM|nr:uridine kinase [Defluviitalea raffinosedens]MBM7685318.1 uridine kinase [Defluviitalea raffinosedens]MBZ4668187.1 udk [Defluviitaleaceae bacterium]MDK2789310.1 uridine kinase [Candidatus Epulonipiscium sp.]HHW67243.1 uridine kinase [Candidatus Epulonipiscium sp.]